MAILNETVSRECRFLGEEYFDTLYSTFIEAFSDYVFPFALTERQFRNHINLNAVDLARTAGFIENGELKGFSLNGFGTWHGRVTVYDAGTGVIPSARRRGISEALFNFMLPQFKAENVEQCLLEVITTNTGAVRLYEKLGFTPVRELVLLQCDKQIAAARSSLDGLETRVLEIVNWPEVERFWSGQPSWQNSKAAVDRSRALKRCVGAYIEERCIGYIVYSGNFGRVAQLAVDPEFRDQGVGTALLRELQRDTFSGYSLQIINLDTSIPGAIEFFCNRGFYERLRQYEMVRAL